MPPTILSRHRFSLGYLEDGVFFLGDRTPYEYRDLADNRQHVVVLGDTLFNLAGRYFEGMSRAAGLWWIIADFQPIPVHDPTIRLVEGTTIVVPSLRTVQQEIFNERRRRALESGAST